MNTLEQISIRSPAEKDETCAKFVIDDISFPFTFHNVTKAGQQYTLGFYVKSETAGTLTIFDKVYNTTTEWQKLAITFDATEANVSIFFSTLGTYYFYHTQLETGCKDTHFERAPEDVEEEIQSVSNKTAELVIDLDSIISRVSATETDMNSLESRVNVAETKLTADGLTTIIGTYYTTTGDVNNAIAGIEIGGRNLIRGTKDFIIDLKRETGWTHVSSEYPVTIENDADGFAVASISMADLTSGKNLGLFSSFISCKTNDTFTVSMWFMIDDTSVWDWQIPLIIEGWDSSKARIAWRDLTITDSLTNKPTVTNGEWVKFEVTAKIQVSDSGFNRISTDRTIDEVIYFSVRPQLARNGSIHFKKVKVEVGSKATDWSPAPEDTEKSIYTLSEQTNSTFRWLISNYDTADSTSFTLTDRTAELIAQTISLNGDVKVNGDMLVDGTITTEKFATNALMSTNYAYSTGNYSTAGTYFDLSTGLIRSKNFSITTTGDVYFKGDVDATTIMAKDEYKIYTGSYGNETIIKAYDWGGDASRGVIIGFEYVTHPSCMQFYTSSGGGIISFYASGSASFGCRVYFDDAVSIYGETNITSTLSVSGNTTINGLLTSSADTSLRFPIGAGTTTVAPYVQLRKAGSSGSYTLSLVYYDAAGTATFNQLVDSSGALCLASGSSTLKVSASTYVLLQASGFAVRIGSGFDTSNDVIVPVTTANVANNGNVFLGAASARFKILYSSSAVNVSSDERDKNITELDDRYLNAFDKLQIITYRWKNDPEKLHIGMSAQAARRALLEAGIDADNMSAIAHDFWTDEVTNEEKERYSLIYEELIMLTIPVVQKHSVTLNDHTTKLINIEAQLESLKTELDEAHIQIAELKKLVNVS